MLTEICQYLRNWFVREKWLGDFKISDGVLTYADGTALPLLDGQYFRVVGSVLNDGVHKTGNAFADEEFNGAVWSMAIPPDFLSLVANIEEWSADNASVISSPYQSESFGNYSYSLRGGTNAEGAATGATWQSQFEARLAPWRKI